MRIFRIVKVPTKDVVYFRIEEKVGIIFKKWVPIILNEDSKYAVEFGGTDCATLINRLAEKLGTVQSWKFDTGYRSLY